MKPSAPLKRRTPLRTAKTGSTVARLTILPAQPRKPARRPLAPVSAQRLAEAPARRKVRAEVFERDGGCVLRFDRSVPPCFGGDTFHHVRKASAGGAYSVANGRCLCVFHNGWVEDFPTRGAALGLVER